MKAVLDTNIYVSGIHWTGAPDKILRAMLLDKFSSITSNELLDEFVSVMKSFKIPMKAEEIMMWENLIISKSEIVEPKEKIKAVKDDPKDDKVIEAAIEGKCDYIVTRDKKHLLKLKEFRDIRIITPEEFLKLIEL